MKKTTAAIAGFLKDHSVKLYADGADLDSIIKLYHQGIVSGFTTNPTLMRQAGVQDYEGFAKDVLTEVTDLPVSFEVFADDFQEIEQQARTISSWGQNVFVKIPIVNTKGESAVPTVKILSHEGIKLNVTAIMTLEQVTSLADVLHRDVSSVISIFAGRIADTGVDPVPLMKSAVAHCEENSNAEILWASPREVLNIYQADEIGCHIITISPSLVDKISLYRKSLEDYSLETVKMFYADATASGFSIEN